MEKLLKTILMQQLQKLVKKLHFVVLTVVSKTDNDAFGAYLHMGGRIGVLTVVEGTTDDDVAKDIAMHVAAINPKYVSRDEVSQEEVEHEREVLTQQALNEGKPEKIVEKMVEGRIGKYFEEYVYLTKHLLKILIKRLAVCRIKGATFVKISFVMKLAKEWKSVRKTSQKK